MAGRRATVGSANIFQILKRDHGEVSVLLGRLERTTSDAEWKRLYADLRVALTGHSKAEERLIYPRLRKEKVSHDFGEHATEEHEEMKSLLRVLDRSMDNENAWDLALKDLKMTIKDHVREEESEGFRRMRKVFTEKELEKMGKQFEAAKKILNPVRRLVRKRPLARRRKKSIMFHRKG